jgi:uncharacterized protein
MAELVVDGDELVVHLTATEHAATLHRDVRVPLAAVRSADVVADPVGAVRGWKLVGARVPGALALGTFDHKGSRCFAAVHHGARGVRVTLDGAHYDVLVVTCDDPASVVARLTPVPGD